MNYSFSDFYFKRFYHRLTIFKKFFNYKNFSVRGFYFSKFLRNKVSQYSVPVPEYGAYSLTRSIFRKIVSNLEMKSTLSATQVKEADSREVDVYCRFKNFMPTVDLNVFYKSIEYLIDFFKFNEFDYLRIKDYDECLDVLPKDTSSGYPLYKKKGNLDAISHSNYLSKIFNNEYNTNVMIKHIIKYPTTIFHRFTPKIKSSTKKRFKCNFKIRQIFGVPQFICQLEVMYFSSFVELFKLRLKNIYTSGLTKLEISSLILKFRSKAQSKNLYIMCGDISSCDKSISNSFHEVFFAFLSLNINTNLIVDKILVLGKYLTYTPIISTKFRVDVSKGSTVTGSWITSIFTTFCVLLALIYSYKKVYDEFPNLSDFLIQGDDFLLLIKDKNDAEEIKKYMLHLNLRLKLETTKISSYCDDVEFLGYFWDKRGEPFQVDEWIVARILFPEKFVRFKGQERIIIRYLSLIFQLRNYKELFNKFLQHDSFLRRKFLLSDRPTFLIMDARGNISYNRFPLKDFLMYGWKMF